MKRGSDSQQQLKLVDCATVIIPKAQAPDLEQGLQVEEDGKANLKKIILINRFKKTHRHINNISYTSM